MSTEKRKEGKEKKRGPIRKTLWGLFLPLTAPFYIARWILRDLGRIARWVVRTITDMPRIVRDGRADVHRAFEEERQRPPVDIREVLEAWDVTDAESARQKSRELAFHAGVWSLVLAFGLVGLYAAPGALVVGGALGLVCVASLGILTALWRRHILRAPRYVYFTDWLRGRI